MIPPKPISQKLVLQEFSVQGQSVSIQLPASEEELLNEAIAGATVDAYWGKLWDAAIESASCVLQTNWSKNLSALELGCGAGMLGIAGLMAGLDVTFSDHEPKAVALAIQNAKLNGFDNCEGIVLDWAKPDNRQFDLLLASDVLYQKDSHLLLVNLAHTMLKEDGKMLIGDPGRNLSKSFLSLASSLGIQIQIYDKNLQSRLTPFDNQFIWLVLSPE